MSVLLRFRWGHAGTCMKGALLGQWLLHAVSRTTVWRAARVQPPIVNVSWTTFEIGFSWPVTSPGAVPLTMKALSVACTFLPKKPGEPTSQVLRTSVRPRWLVTEFSWNTPARLAFGPPAPMGVVDSVTTRPGAPGSGMPGPNVFAGGRLSPGR